MSKNLEKTPKNASKRPKNVKNVENSENAKNMLVEGRAYTPEQKRSILARLYTVWTQDRIDQLRLGQLLSVAVVSPSSPDLFYIEDEQLATCVEQLGRDNL